MDYLVIAHNLRN